MIENSFYDLIGWFISIIVVIKLITFVLEIHNKNNEIHDKFDKDVNDFYQELLKEKLRHAHNKNNSDWLKVNKDNRDKILKVKVMSERGEGGERQAAENRLKVLLLKNNLKLSDIPAYKT